MGPNALHIPYLPPAPTDRSGSWGRFLLLPRHREMHCLFRIDHMVGTVSSVSNGDLHPLHPAGELIAMRAVVLGNRRAGIQANIATIVRREDHGRCGRDLPLADLLAIH